MAITFDTSTQLYNAAEQTNPSGTHVCTGSNRYLFVWIANKLVSAGADSISAVTYAGVSMSKVGTGATVGDRNHCLWALANPASGSNTVQVTGTNTPFAAAFSYTGAIQTQTGAGGGGTDASTTQAALAQTNITTTITTVADNCWSILVTNPGATAGTGATLISGTNFSRIFDSAGLITPAGSHSMTVNAGGSNISMIMCSFAPFAATTSSFQLSLVGVGV